jgi:glycosyltransferase involved in cell wall biosynthesis
LPPVQENEINTVRKCIVTFDWSTLSLIKKKEFSLMKLLINTATTFKGGGVQVALSFIWECRNFEDYEFHVVLGETISTLIKDEEYPPNFTFYRIGFRPATRLFSLKSHNRYLKDLERKIDPDVVFTTSGPAYWRPKAPHLIGYNLPHYIYRDSPYFSTISFIQRMKWDIKGAVLKFYFKREADAYVVQTDDVNQRLRKWLNTSPVHTVSNTFSSHYQSPKKVKNKLPDKKEGEYRLLSLSAWYPHKNLGIIPDVIDSLKESIRKRIRFILTLPDDDFRRNFPDEYRDFVINTGPIKPDEGPALYSECDALFLPTLLECFSASYAEAMVMGKPIITSDLGFARTVCRNAALYAEPLNPIDYSQKISELIDSDELKKSLIKRGNLNLKQFLSASDRAEQYLNICKELADARKN